MLHARTRVALTPCHRYHRLFLDPALERLLASLGGPQAPLGVTIARGDRVLLKPNLLTGGKPRRECTTRPELVEFLAERLLDLGARPFLGDSPAFGSALGVARANGYDRLLRRLDLPVVDFHGQRYPVPDSDFGHLWLAREAMEADVVINLPKVKSHVQLGLSLGVKNLFGCVPGKMKAWWHMESGGNLAHFADMLVATARLIAPALTLADGVIGHEGNGPSNGDPRPLGVLAASRDVFSLDQALVAVLDLDPAVLPTLAAARRAGIDPGVPEYCLSAPAELAVRDWRLSDRQAPIDFGAPRVLRSVFRNLYIRYIKEPIAAYRRG